MAAKRILLIILTAALIAFTGCSLSGSSGDKTPDSVKSARNSAMKAAQDTAHELEGEWVDRITNLENYAQNADAKDTAEYKSLADDLKDYAKDCKADRLYIMAVNDDEYLLIVDSDNQGSSWHEKENVDAQAADKAYSDGLISAEHTGWKADDKYYWTAYAPLYNQNNEITYVLGADISNKKLADYPDWISEKGGE